MSIDICHHSGLTHPALPGRLSSLNVWLGGNRLADSDWRWTTGEIITDDIWGTEDDSSRGDCLMLRDRQWSQQPCAGLPNLPTVFLAQKGHILI